MAMFPTRIQRGEAPLLRHTEFERDLLLARLTGPVKSIGCALFSKIQLNPK